MYTCICVLIFTVHTTCFSPSALRRCYRRLAPRKRDTVGLVWMGIDVAILQGAKEREVWDEVEKVSNKRWP